MQRRNRRLGSAQKGRADLDRVGAERESRRDSASIADPAGRHHRQPHGVAHLRQECDQSRLRIDVVGEEHAAMAARFAPLSDDAVGSIVFEPARLGDSRGGRKDQRAGRLDAREQRSRRQAEMKAHDRGPRLFNDRAHGRVEGRTDRRGGNGGGIEAGLGIEGRESLAPARLDLGIGLGLAMGEKIDVERRVRRLPDGGDLVAQAIGREHGGRQ